MSTRSTTHFKDSMGRSAIIYRHTDGYPTGAGRDLEAFLERCSTLPDPRFNDAPYLAAKYVVFLAEMFHEYAYRYVKRDGENGYDRLPPSNERLDFLSVGIVSADPGDIEYRYFVDCHKLDESGRPMLRVQEATGAPTFSKPELVADAIARELAEQTV